MIENSLETERKPSPISRFSFNLLRWLAALFLSTLTRRIVFLNVAAMATLVVGVLYLNQFQAGLIDARVESLLTQGQIIARAISQTAPRARPLVLDPEEIFRKGLNTSPRMPAVNSNQLDFSINPVRVAPILRELIEPTKTRARIYDTEGRLLLDSRFLFSPNRLDKPRQPHKGGWWQRAGEKLKIWLQRLNLPLYEKFPPEQGRSFPEVKVALNGSVANVVSVSAIGELIISVAVPVRKTPEIRAALVLSTEGGDIDAIVYGERLAIVQLFLVAVTVTVFLSVILASTVSGPIRRLAAVAHRVRRGVKRREEVPDFGARSDEIGELAGAFRDMTNSLYDRIAAIEHFTADVAHELKNPLTSIRSAVETLPLAKAESDRQRLLSVINHDVGRMDRLINDISDASRVDAELALSEMVPINLAPLLATVIEISNLADQGEESLINLQLDEDDDGANRKDVLGIERRLAQVFSNLIDNARSFSGVTGKINVTLTVHDWVLVMVDDDGTGIPKNQFERIFERFYTDRPTSEEFGRHSGLGSRFPGR